ncbi:hypothetical protein [Rhizobium sullae]|uniref:Uncharacterized protein n=1 Tax=Rhizobium sullae TaxID=50338 RepID=A0A2N0D814_RHISU|nr:hypothetical protein [Rhizobium sullae]PKA42240.1 hypothetical protein CWR43_19255 [Rhizobium sullae]UWU18258.1 hypothetical protein N2599_23665 [Rhizobium sullae]
MTRRDIEHSKGLDTDADLQAHLAELEAEAPAEEVLTPPADDAPSKAPLQRIKDDLDHVRNEIEILGARLSLVKQQTVAVARSKAEWADASAHAQLGAYPWAKLAAAMAATAVGARVLRRPPGAVAAAIIPPLIARFEAKSRP